MNNFLGDFKRIISNFNEDSILELALCILKDKVQSLSIVTIAVVSLSTFNSMLVILVGKGTDYSGFGGASFASVDFRCE